VRQERRAYLNRQSSTVNKDSQRFLVRMTALTGSVRGAPLLHTRLREPAAAQ